MDTLAKNHAERIKAEAVEWRLLVLDGKLGPEEQRAFDAWLAGDPRHQTAYQHAAEIWEAFGAISRDNLSPELFIPQSQTLLPRLPSFIRSLGFEKPQFVFMTLVAALVTTAVAFLASNGERQHVQPASAVVSFETVTGEVRSVVLPDETNVTLGAATELRVTMSDTERRVELLRGAATFDVSVNAKRPFFVEAQALTVKVTGTLFDVRSNGDVVRVSVAEGSVQARHPTMIASGSTGMITQRELGAGQRLTASKDEGLSRVTSFKPQNFALWRDGRLRYAGATLRELIADANRYSEREIILGQLSEPLSAARITTTFRGQDINGLLATLPDLFNVDINVQPDGSILIQEKAL